MSKSLYSDLTQSITDFKSKTIESKIEEQKTIADKLIESNLELLERFKKEIVPEYNLVMDSLEKVKHKILKFNKENQNILGDITKETENKLKLDANLIENLLNKSKRFFEHK